MEANLPLGSISTQDSISSKQGVTLGGATLPPDLLLAARFLALEEEEGDPLPWPPMANTPRTHKPTNTQLEIRKSKETKPKQKQMKLEFKNTRKRKTIKRKKKCNEKQSREKRNATRNQEEEAEMN